MKGTWMHPPQCPKTADGRPEEGRQTRHHRKILIRNDLSRVAEDVRVDKCYTSTCCTPTRRHPANQFRNQRGRLPEDYPHHLENPRCPAPSRFHHGVPLKDKTMQIIQEAEGYDRGFYTGIMGNLRPGRLNSAVMIRSIEEETSPVDFEADGEKEISRQTKRKKSEEKPKIVFQGRRRHHFEERLPEGIRGSDSENLSSVLNPPFILENKRL